MLSQHFIFALLFLYGENVYAETRVAIAHLSSGSVTGIVEFAETTGGVRVTGTIIGLEPGHYGFHIHELGDVSTCTAAGAHFNPDGSDHGGRDHSVRHVGDLGNIEFVGNDSAVATIDFVDSVINLRGRYDILGRALVLHEQEDDLGLAGDEGSLTTGNAGARVACGVIGIKSPVEPWNSALATAPSIALLVTVSVLFFNIF